MSDLLSLIHLFTFAVFVKRLSVAARTDLRDICSALPFALISCDFICHVVTRTTYLQSPVEASQPVTAPGWAAVSCHVLSSLACHGRESGGDTAPKTNTFLQNGLREEKQTCKNAVCTKMPASSLKNAGSCCTLPPSLDGL